MGETWNKKSYSPDDLTDAQGAKEMQAESIRKSLAYNSYGNQTEFDVIVLTKPIPMSPSDANSVFRANTKITTTNNTGNAGVFGSPGALEGSISFRGRIIGNGFISPHASIPDPCNLDMAASAGAAIKIISLHTQFMSVPGYKGRIPNIGDTVKVKLMAGDVDKNLQYAFFSELAQASGESVAASLGASCSTLVDKFKNFDPNVDFESLALAYTEFSAEGTIPRGMSRQEAKPYIDAIMAKINADPAGTLGYTPLGEGMCGYPSDFPMSRSKAPLKAKYPVQKCKSATIGTNSRGKAITVVGHPVWVDTLQKMYNDAKNESWFKEALSQNQIAPILTSRGYRSLETQAYLRIKNCGQTTYEQVTSRAGKGVCKPPTASVGMSRHNLGLAIDFGGLIGSDGNSKAHKWLESKGIDGDGTYAIKNYQTEDWHWSVDGH